MSRKVSSLDVQPRGASAQAEPKPDSGTINLHRAFRYRLYPTAEQEAALGQWSGVCRLVSHNVRPACARSDLHNGLRVNTVVGANGSGRARIAADRADLIRRQDSVAVALTLRVHAIGGAVDHVVGPCPPRKVGGIDAGAIVANACRVAGIEAGAGVLTPAGDYQCDTMGLSLTTVPSNRAVPLGITGKRPIHAAVTRLRNHAFQEGEGRANARRGVAHRPKDRPDTLRVQAAFRCVHCGHEDNADVNAAKEILRRGTAGLGAEAEVARPVRRQSQELQHV